MSIKPIDKTSIHRITSGQVVIDLQTAVKELVENSLDAGATNLEVRFKQYGLTAIEVIDNGTGISEGNYEGLALKNHTSKLSSFTDLTTVTTFGFRGEALSSLCALCESVVVSTSTQPPMGVTLELESSGKIRNKGKVARQRGTTITLTNLFSTLPVRRKEFERNAKREFGKALALLNAYALGPCSSRNGVRLIVSNQADKGQKSVQIRTSGTPSLRESVSALWGPKALDNIATLDLRFPVERDTLALKRAVESETAPIQVVVRGLVSKFSVGCGRTGTDRQFFYVNGRPCNISKVQKAFNEVYRSFNATQSPFIVADFILPTDSCDINVSPDKRSILLHHEANLISALKTTLESSFASSRSTYDVESTHQKTVTEMLLPASNKSSSVAAVAENEEEANPSNSTTSNAGATECEPQRAPSRLPLAQNSQPAPVTPNPTRITATTSSSVHTKITSISLSENSKQQSTSPFLVPEPIEIAPKTKKAPGSVQATPVVDPPPPSNGSSQGSTEDVVVTLGSSSANWQRKLQLARKLPDDDELESISAPSDKTPAQIRKKHRSEPDGVDCEPERSPPVTQTAGTQSARQNLRSMLVGFSGSGRVPEAIAVDEDEEDELESSDEPQPRISLDPPKKTGPSSADEDEDVSMHLDLDDTTGPTPPPVGSKPAPRDDAYEDEGIPMQVDVDAEDVMYSADSASHPPSNMDRDGVEEITVVRSKNAVLTNSSTAIDLTDEDLFESSELSSFALDTTLSATPSLDEVVSRPEVIRTPQADGDVPLRFNMSKISSSWRRLLQSRDTTSARREEDVPSTVLRDAGITDATSDDVATEVLARTITKDDFGLMEILGQFNLGFIIVRRRKDEDGAAMDDLFIVDQHAADEKYNFETLQQTTRIKSQKLFRPQPLELTAGDELLALENIDVLRQNGFEVETAAEGGAGLGPRLSLTAQPVSKDTVFDMKDLEEIIHRMRDQPTGQMVRCSKARAMFAMRACRKSVMIGMPLNKGQMTTVVRHMGTMDQPWNCPHGRPTMRHLACIAKEQDRRSVNWAGFAESG
ncbi:Mismatch repair endonuclease PMS2 [Mycena sanguinolenta]|uniref:DNA mismatch repair protein PMS1 n=1 Tax=Mycena sanguinolenta TaxID=230812 RepID=A0A8H7CKA5_9AGAR|nr:Mismatch repair endonuclease PMS2 [Mycena sanguinolenta]